MALTTRRYGVKLQVFGDSDDLIEIEQVDEEGNWIKDGFSAEFYVSYGDLDDAPVYVGFSDGTLLRISYDGFWHIVCLEKGDCKIEHRSATDPDDDYSDIVTLECVDGFSWVTCGKKMERLSGQLDFFAS